MKHKLLSILLCLAMALSLLPTAALADEGKVAQVDGTEYTTLQAAIGAASSGATVKLLGNVDLAETLIIKDKTITLDLNGKTISNSTDIWNESIYAWSLISVRDNGNLLPAAHSRRKKMTALHWMGMPMTQRMSRTPS